MRMLKSLAAALLIGAAPAPAAAAPALPDAEPAMWVVKDRDTTIYLFGTFHALDGKRDWFNDEVRAAFDASQEVVLEIITPDNPAEMRPALVRHAFTPAGAPTLSSKLSPAGRTRLAQVLAKHKMPPGSLDRFRPFFASVTLATLQFGAMGMGAEQGAEAVIKRAIKGTDKQLGAVETIDEQFALLNALPEAEQIKILEATLQDDGSARDQISSMLDAWHRGDARAVARAIQQSDKDSPSLYKLMFTQRNARWAQWVDRRLDRPGTVFLAVGAGHLAGNRSLVDLLRRDGLRVSRVQ